MKKIFLVLISLSVCFNVNASENKIILSPGFTIYLNDIKSAPINKAIDILQRDLLAVLGKKSPVKLAAENER